MSAQRSLFKHESWADIEGEYRYGLGRQWNADPFPRTCWIMLNPSTADASLDDPTIRRCVGFSKRWLHGSIIVVNLFALRSTDPRALLSHADPVGARNDEAIYKIARGSSLIVAAWGTYGVIHDRGSKVVELLRGNGLTLHHLGLTAAGSPRHPLYLRADTAPQPWT